MTVLKYTFIMHPSLPLRSDRVIYKLQRTLESKRGWARMGYTFRYIGDAGRPDFVIAMVPNEVVTRKCRFDGLSCADTRNNVIYLNAERWAKGSVASGLALGDYRTYIIMHEVGHLLGRGHHRCVTGKAPVMMQQTLGIGKCSPNPWPLDWE